MELTTILILVIAAGIIVLLLLFRYIKSALKSYNCKFGRNTTNFIDFICCRRRCTYCGDLAHCGKLEVYGNAYCECRHYIHLPNKCTRKVFVDDQIMEDEIETTKYVEWVDQNYEEETDEIIGYKDVPKKRINIIGTKKVTKYRDIVTGQKEEQYEEREIINYQDEEYQEEVFDKYEFVPEREYKHISTDSVPYLEPENYEETEYYTEYEDKERWVSNPHFGYKTVYVNGFPTTESYTEYRLEREVEYNVPVQKSKQVTKSRDVIKYKDEKVFDWVTTEKKVSKMKLVIKTRRVPVYGMVKKTKMVDIIISEPYDIDEDITETETIIEKVPIYKVVVKQRQMPMEKSKTVVVKKPRQISKLTLCQCTVNGGHKCSCSKCKRPIDINTPLLSITIK